MTREIRLDQISDVMDEAVTELVEKVTLTWTERVKKATPVDTGNLRNGWKTDIKKFKGTIINNIEYAEPVCYGTSLPPSWQGKFRTRQQTIKGFPELIGKDLESYAKGEYENIKRRI